MLVFFSRPTIVFLPQVDLQKETLINFLSLEVGLTFPQLYRAELIKEADGELMGVGVEMERTNQQGAES